ncbi:MAG: hypothetical protein ACYDGX_09835 [Thermoleophilia bacterium]
MIRYVLMALFPITVLLIAFAPEGLSLWLGQEFADNGTRVLQLLAVGVFMNSLAQIPFVLIQGAGRPDITARLHLIELPIYIAALWWGVTRFGINGAALVWLIRAFVDMTFLFLMSHHLYFRGKALMNFRGAIAACVIIGTFIVAALPLALAPKLLFTAGVFTVSIMSGWLFLLSGSERRFLLMRLHLESALK